MKLEDMTEAELGEMMTQMARSTERWLTVLGVERPLFCLLVFNDPKLVQYVANCERGCMIQALREAAERLESRQDVVRSHGGQSNRGGKR